MGFISTKDKTDTTRKAKVAQKTEGMLQAARRQEYEGAARARLQKAQTYISYSPIRQQHEDLLNLTSPQRNIIYRAGHKITKHCSEATSRLQNKLSLNKNQLASTPALTSTPLETRVSTPPASTSRPTPSAPPARPAQHPRPAPSSKPISPSRAALVPAVSPRPASAPPTLPSHSGNVVAVPSQAHDESHPLYNPRHVDPSINVIDFAYKDVLPEHNSDSKDSFDHESHISEDDNDVPPPPEDCSFGTTDVVAGAIGCSTTALVVGDEVGSDQGKGDRPIAIKPVAKVNDPNVEASVQLLLESSELTDKDKLKAAKDKAMVATTKLEYSRQVAMKAQSDLREAGSRIKELEQEVEILKLELNATKSSCNENTASSEGEDMENSRNSDADVEELGSTPPISSDEEEGPVSRSIILHETENQLSPTGFENEDSPSDPAGVVGDSNGDGRDSIQQQAEKVFGGLVRKKVETGQDLGLMDVVQAVIRQKDDQYDALVKDIEVSSKNEQQDLKNEYELKLTQLHQELHESNESHGNLAHEERKINKSLAKELEESHLKYENAEKAWGASQDQLEERVTFLANQLQQLRTSPNEYYDDRIRGITEEAWSWQESAYQHRGDYDSANSKLIASKAAFDLTFKRLNDEIEVNKKNNAQLEGLLNAKDFGDAKLKDQVEHLQRMNNTKDAQILSLLQEARETREGHYELYSMMQGRITRSELISKLHKDFQRAEASREREVHDKFEAMQRKDEELKRLSEWKTSSKVRIELRNAKIKELESQNQRLELINSTNMVEIIQLRIYNEHLDSESALWTQKIAHYSSLAESLQVARNDPEAVDWARKYYTLSAQNEANIDELLVKQRRINDSEEIERECLERALGLETRLRDMCWDCDKNELYKCQNDALVAENSALRERFADELKDKPLDLQAEQQECAELKLDRLQSALKKFTPLATDKDWRLCVYAAVGDNCTKPWNVLMLSEEQHVMRGIIHCKQQGVEIPIDLQEQAGRFSIDVSNVDPFDHFDAEKWYPLAERLFMTPALVDSQSWSTSEATDSSPRSGQSNAADCEECTISPEPSIQSSPLEASLVPQPLAVDNASNQLSGTSIPGKQSLANTGVIGQRPPAPLVPPGFEHLFPPTHAIPTHRGVGEIGQGKPSRQPRNLSPSRADSEPSKHALASKSQNAGVIGDGRPARILPAVPAQIFPIPEGNENIDSEPSKGAPAADDGWEDVSLEGPSTSGSWGMPIEPRRARASTRVASLTEANFSS